MARLIHVLALAFCVGISVILGDPVPVFNDCGSKVAKINSINITPCATEPCQLVKGQNVSVVLEFTTNKQITKASAVVHAIVLDVRVPHEIPNPDACKDSGLKCPIAAGGTYNYTSSLLVSKSYPSIKFVVEWELQDQDGDVIWCFQVPAQVEG
ncbi:PREDICTED: epididymal secretory protein E1-like [Branchiostoma belcheri]|uniref:NPC intracellular cholesterol transporter 2 n=1 Tax=Branchiostoma belcheri TaxID=7741 RepID=A0A6P4ZH58_BRABE|nr:PREDICTED: epididymal secretory protein E1-like [Branchiostoma belcheri]